MFETREGILKHCSRKNAEKLGDVGQRFLVNERPGLEAQIANIADEIAYNNHDVDDGLRAGLLNIDQLRECELVEEHYQKVIDKWGKLDDSTLRHEIIRRMINAVVSDLINNSMDNIKQLGPESIYAVRTCGKNLIAMSEIKATQHQALKSFLRKNLYQHERVQKMANQAKQTVTFLFDAYMKEPRKLNEESWQTIVQLQKTGKQKTIPRIIADYIAGMTDRFAFAEVDRIKA